MNFTFYTWLLLLIPLPLIILLSLGSYLLHQQKSN